MGEVKEMNHIKLGMFDLIGDSGKVRGFDFDFEVDESIDQFLDIYEQFPGK